MKKTIGILLLTLLAAGACAQKSFLPGNAEYIRHTPSSITDMFVLLEQRGVVPYKGGHNCDDGDGYFVLTDESGKRYGETRWMDVHVKINSYKTAGKLMFDQTMQYYPPSQELSRIESSWRSEQAPPTVKRDITTFDVTDGKMLMVKDVHTCTDEDRYKGYTFTSFTSYAVFGSTIVWIESHYLHGDVSLATKLHHDIIEKIKSTGVE